MIALIITVLIIEKLLVNMPVVGFKSSRHATGNSWSGESTVGTFTSESWSGGVIVGVFASESWSGGAS